MDRLGLEEGEVITHRMVTKSIERAQKKVEQNNFGIRKRQLDYDDVLNAQREVIYSRRMHALKGDRLHVDILDMLNDFVIQVVGKYYGDGDVDGLRDEILRTIAFDFEMDRETFVTLGEDGVVDHVYEGAAEFYQAKRRALAQPFYRGVKQMVDSDLENKPEKLIVQFTDGRKLLRAVCDVETVLESDGFEIDDALERVAVLSTIDDKWTDHLRELDELKSGIGLRAFGQKDPLLEYKMEAFNLFQQMLEDLNRDVVSLVLKAGPLAQGEARTGDRAPVRGRSRAARLDRSRASATHDSSSGYGVDAGAFSVGAQGDGGGRRDPTTKAQPVIAGDRVGRNAPCPCGSGKKYKHCHGRG
jgi:preprotein translocase subunit SecA